WDHYQSRTEHPNRKMSIPELREGQKERFTQLKSDLGVTSAEIGIMANRSEATVLNWLNPKLPTAPPPEVLREMQMRLQKWASDTLLTSDKEWRMGDIADAPSLRDEDGDVVKVQVAETRL